MKSYRVLILFIICAGYLTDSHAQDDKKALSTAAPFSSTQKNTVPGKDSTIAAVIVKKDTVPKHNPRLATMRSLMVPGWGQAYNKEYWKIPIIYGILAIPTATFFFNNSYYKKTKFAYEARFAEQNKDSSLVPLIDPELKNLGISSLQNYRNSFRRDRDYSVLWFFLAWALQVADATVFAHLKQFDVSNDLSMELKPTFNPQTRTPGFGLTLNMKSPPKRSAITR
ncbi:MAG: hypothetical protein JWQ30_1913 [Sediminibacterium sp.]|nr:hypothetical protein [Sediminibacterium sp.]